MKFREWRKYIVTLAITLVIFITAIGISMWIDNARVNNIRTLQDNISMDMLSSETQFNLLKDASCSDLFNSDLATQLSDIGDRLSFMESNGHNTDADVISLRQYYYTLEIKDYILIKSATKCPLKPTTVLYFYEPNCSDCDKQGDVLTYLRQHYPDNVRVYSFDYSLNTGAVQTLASINKVGKPLPAIVIDGTTYQGFNSVDDILALKPQIASARTRIVLSPHLDDAALSIGGLIAKSTHSVGSPVIVTVFTGTPNTPVITKWDSEPGFKNSTETMKKRISENASAAYILGASTVNFGYLDNEYRRLNATSTKTPVALSTSTLESKIAADIIKLIKSSDTSTSSMEIYGPAIFDGKVGHPDHTILHEAYMNVISTYKPRGIVTFFIYEDFPYAKWAGIPKTDITKTLSADSSQYFYAPIYIPLNTDIVSTKKDAISSYSSQVKAMDIDGISKTASSSPIDIITLDIKWMSSRCNGLFRIPSACEVVYQVQK